MKIVFLATQFPDYSVEAATALSRFADVLLVADEKQLAADSCTAKREALYRAGRLVTFRQHRFYRLTAWLAIAWRVALFRPAFIIAHIDPRPHVTLSYGLVSRITRLVLVVHDPVPHSGRDWAFAERNRWSIVRQIPMAKYFLAHGPHCAALWRQGLMRGMTATFRLTRDPDGGGDHRPVIAVPHGPILRPATCAPLPERCRILMFGRMEAYKGLDILLDAMAILRERPIDLEVRIAGDGPELERLEPQFRAIGNCSIRRGFVPRQEAMREFGAASIAVMPYTEATQSGVAAAAFANGRSVIASAVGGVPDFVRDGVNGLLVPPNDAKALADAMMRIATDRVLLARLTAAARVSSEGEMSWKTYAETVIAHLGRK